LKKRLLLGGVMLALTAVAGCDRLRAADAVDLSNAFGPKAERRALPSIPIPPP